jgi:hypothetical protein
MTTIIYLNILRKYILYVEYLLWFIGWYAAFDFFSSDYEP